MKIGVVIFPGSNCDHDIIYVLQNLLGQEVVELWHKTNDTKGCDLIVLPGGFSYGDYLRSGAIARFSPIMNNVAFHKNFQVRLLASFSCTLITDQPASYL